MAMQATLSRGHDEDLFENWYRSHQGPLQSYCTRFLRDTATAADVTQETLLRAWTRRDQFMSDSQVRPWLFRVARNLCIDTIRTRSRVVPSDSLPERVGEGDAGTPMERAAVATVVRQAMTHLSDRHQHLLVQREVEGITYDELAAQMGVTVEGARAVLFRARRCLQQSLERIEAEESDAAYRCPPFRLSVREVRIPDLSNRKSAVEPGQHVERRELCGAVVVALQFIG